MFVCPTCGAARAPRALFCHVCGAPLPAAAGTPATGSEPNGALDQTVDAPDALATPGAQAARDARPLAVDAPLVAGPIADGSASAPLSAATGAVAGAPLSAVRGVPWGRVALLGITVCLASSTVVLLFLFAGTAASASSPGGAPLVATSTTGNLYELTPSVPATVTTFAGTAMPTATQVSGGGGPGAVPTATPKPAPTATTAPTAAPTTAPSPTATKPSF